MNPMDMMKFAGMWKEFAGRHPKFPLFLNALSQNGITEGTILEIQVKQPNGTELSSNLKITKEDMELFQKLREMR